MDRTTLKTRAHVYLIGGWGSGARIWQGVTEYLKRASLRFVIVDWQEMLRDPQMLDRFWPDHQAAAEPVVLAGWSLGGMLALEAVLRHQTAVKGLAMIGSTARMCEATSYPGVDPRAIRAMKRKLRSQRPNVLRDFAQRCFTDTVTGQVVDPRACEAYSGQSESCKSESLADGLDYLLKTDFRDGLDVLSEQNTCKIEILHARDDAVMPCTEAAYLARQIPHGRLTLLESGTHALPIVVPEKVAEVILSLCGSEKEGGADDR